MKPFRFIIDIVARCNLQCQSCPMGNSPPMKKRGNMSPDLLNEILKKATDESVIDDVHFYNWTEPFLHPKLSEMIGVVNSYGLGTRLSSNLNVMPKIDDVLEANPEYLTVSLSGFTQDVYTRTHTGGNIERVKENMALLADSKARTGSKTKLETKYLLYLGNIEDAIHMKKYAEGLGYKFFTEFAGMMPAEKLLAFLTDGKIGDPLTDGDREIIELLAFPHKEMIELTKPFNTLPCSPLEDWMVLNSEGEVQLCFLVYDEEKYSVGNYLTTPIEEIHDTKRKHWQCADCLKLGIPASRAYPIPNVGSFILNNYMSYLSPLGLNFERLRQVGKFEVSIIKLQYFLINKINSSPSLSRKVDKIKPFVPRRFRRFGGQDMEISRYD